MGRVAASRPVAWHAVYSSTPKTERRGTAPYTVMCGIWSGVDPSRTQPRPFFHSTS